MGIGQAEGEGQAGGCRASRPVQFLAHVITPEVDGKTARDAGVSDAETIEVVAHIALNVFTNYLNSVSGTAIDFPDVPLATAA